MTIAIRYHEQFKNETISSYTYWWAYDFGDMALDFDESQHGYKYALYSADSNPPTVGVKYAFQSTSPQSKAAIVMESKGMHTAMIMEVHGVRTPSTSPLIPGKSEILQFGEYLAPIPYSDLDAPQSHQLRLKQVQLEFRGLNISDDIDISMIEVIQDMLKNNSYPSNIDLGVYGLLRGNNTYILEIFQSQGIDVNTPLKDLAIASQFDMPVIDTVGTTISDDILLVA